MFSLSSVYVALQGIGGIAVVAVLNYIFEQILGRRLLTALFFSIKKWLYKNTKHVEINFTFRIDFNKKLNSNQLRLIIKDYVNLFEKEAQWNNSEITFEAKSSFIHRVKMQLLHNHLEDDFTMSEGIFVSMKTQFKLGDLKDCLSSISSLSDKLIKYLIKSYNLPFLVNNSEFEIRNPHTNLDIPVWLRKEGFKLKIIAEVAEELNLQLYLDHAKIETNGITFEPKISRYLEEIFINYYVDKSFKVN